MFCFTVTGRIGSMQKLAKDGLRISVGAERLAEGPDGAYTRTEWLGCISFDPALNEKLQHDLEVGMNVKLDGRIEPRKRMVDGKALYDTSLFIGAFERLSKPKATAKKPASEDEPAISA